jgi:hypothetical protein
MGNKMSPGHSNNHVIPILSCPYCVALGGIQILKSNYSSNNFLMVTKVPLETEKYL